MKVLWRNDFCINEIENPAKFSRLKIFSETYSLTINSSYIMLQYIILHIAYNFFLLKQLNDIEKAWDGREKRWKPESLYLSESVSRASNRLKELSFISDKSRKCVPLSVLFNRLLRSLPHKREVSKLSRSSLSNFLLKELYQYFKKCFKYILFRVKISKINNCFGQKSKNNEHKCILKATLLIAFEDKITV